MRLSPPHRLGPGATTKEMMQPLYLLSTCNCNAISLVPHLVGWLPELPRRLECAVEHADDQRLDGDRDAGGERPCRRGAGVHLGAVEQHHEGAADGDQDAEGVEHGGEPKQSVDGSRSPLLLAVAGGVEDGALEPAAEHEEVREDVDLINHNPR